MGEKLDDAVKGVKRAVGPREVWEREDGTAESRGPRPKDYPGASALTRRGAWARDHLNQKIEAGEYKYEDNGDLYTTPKWKNTPENRRDMSKAWSWNRKAQDRAERDMRREWRRRGSSR